MKKKAEKFVTKDGNYEGYHFYCPGCDMMHSIYTKGANVPCWYFTGTEENPTISPSVLCTFGTHSTDRCHSFVRNGMIQFLNDCTHQLKGQTVELPEIE